MIISGTGHRPNKLGGYTSVVKNKLFQLARFYIPKNTHAVYSGMALGWDMALAEAAIARDIPLYAAVPFKNQEAMWSPHDQKRYNGILSEAREIIYVSQPGYASFKMHRRNEYLVDNCDTVLALWNGDTFGGTFHCIQYAQSKEKEIINLWDVYRCSL